MKPYQERVVFEKRELDEKLAKLRPFVNNSEVFKQLPQDEQIRMMRQQMAMSEYSSILGERIACFKDAD